MSYFGGGSLRLALKQSLAETKHAAGNDTDTLTRKREEGMKRKKNRRMRQKEKENDLEIQKKLHAAAAARRKAQQQHLGIKSPSSDKQNLDRINSTKRKGSRSSNHSMTSSSSLSSSSSSSSSSNGSSESDSDTSTSDSNNNNSSSSGSSERNMFDTSSSEEMDIDDKSRDTDAESDNAISERTRNDPPSACPKHLLITPNLNEPKRKRDYGCDQMSVSSSNRKEKKFKSEHTAIRKKSPRSTVGSASDRSMTSKKSSSSRRVKSRTVAPPTPDVINLIESMPVGKLRKLIRSGLRVKVRFVSGSSKADRKKHDAVNRRIKWYGGCVSEVYADGKRVRIHYDDGTSEVSDFPDDDIVVDDSENGSHKCPEKAFIPKKKHELEHSLSTILSSREISKCDPMNPNAPHPIAEKSFKMAAFKGKAADKVISKDNRKKERSGDLNRFKNKSEEFHNVCNSRVSPPSTKASTVTDSSYSLSSNNNSANEYSESSCSITSHDLSSTPLQKKIEAVNSPIHNRVDHSVEQKAYSHSDHVLSDTLTRNVPKIKISSSFNRPERSSSTEDTNKNATQASSYATSTECSQPNTKIIGKSLKASTSLTIKLGGSRKKEESSKMNAQKEVHNKEEIRVEGKHRMLQDREIDQSFRKINKSMFRALPPLKKLEKRQLEYDRESLESSKDDVGKIGQSNESNHSEEIYVNDINQGTTIEKMDTSQELNSEVYSSSFEQTHKEKNIEQYISDDRSADPRTETDALTENTHTSINVAGNHEMHHAQKSREKDKNANEVEMNTIDVKGKIIQRSDKNTQALMSRSPSPVLSTNSFKKSIPNEFDRNSFAEHPTVLSTNSDPGSSAKNNLENDGKRPIPETADEIATSLNSNAEDVDFEKNSSVPTSRSGRLAAQKANERIVSKQDIIDEEFATPKKKKEKLELKKKISLSTELESSPSEASFRNDEDEKEDEREPWVQCDRCQKWRLLPRSVRMDSLPDRWYCELNIYDHKRNRCDAPEQTIAEIALQKKKIESTYDIESYHKRPSRNAKRNGLESDCRKKRSVSPFPSRSQKATMNESDEVESTSTSKKDHFGTLKNNDFHERSQNSKLQASSSQQDFSIKKKNQVGSRNTSDKAYNSSMIEKNKDTSNFGPVSKSKNLSKTRGNRKESERSGKGGRGNRHSKDKAENQEWVQCEKCEKWRKLPPRISSKDLPDKWYCDMNTWDLNSASCLVAEDKPDPKVRVQTVSHSNGKLTSSSKLSYRNLIFGSGKRNLRTSSERTRAAESLFAFANQNHKSHGETVGNSHPILAYANSGAFVPKLGNNSLRHIAQTSRKVSFLDVMSKSQLWDELYGFHADPSKVIPYGEENDLNGLHRESTNVFNHDKQLMKNFVFYLVGRNPMTASEILLEAQSNEMESVKIDQFEQVRAICNHNHILLSLEELVKEGSLEALNEEVDECGRKVHIMRYRRVCGDSRNSRCMKISKPWKNGLK